MRVFVTAEMAPHVDAWDEAQAFPRTLYRRAAHVGLLGLGYPEPYDGTPADAWFRLIAIDEIAALAVTEPAGGVDVPRLRWNARHVGDHQVINGDETFITSGMRADRITLAVRTGTVTNQRGVVGISLIAVPGDTPGLTRMQLSKTVWWCSDTAKQHFENCRVPADHLIGDENAGFRNVMENFNAG